MLEKFQKNRMINYPYGKTVLKIFDIAASNKYTTIEKRHSHIDNSFLRMRALDLKISFLVLKNETFSIKVKIHVNMRSYDLILELSKPQS